MSLRGPDNWQDFYSPYNKPKQLIQWLDEHQDLKEATLHVLDNTLVSADVCAPHEAAAGLTDYNCVYNSIKVFPVL